jgi:hypothetical protein
MTGRASSARDAPLPGAYVAAAGVLAGPHPATADERGTRDRLAALAAAGVALVVDLTEPGEAPDYTPLLPRGVASVRFPVRDLTAPSPATTRTILATIDDTLATGGGVYVHCRGGIGRTGAVVGCWLVHRGLAGDDPLATLAALRGAGAAASPETDEQRRLVSAWTAAAPADESR